MKPVKLGNRRELMVDDAMFLSIGSAQFVSHSLQPRECVLYADTENDGTKLDYPVIFRDGGKVKLYYLATSFPEGTRPLSRPKEEPRYAPVNEFGVRDLPAHPLFNCPHFHECYAESEDGVHFVKPQLREYQFLSDAPNNIVYMLPYDVLDNFFVGRDQNPDCLPGEEYKALCERVIDGVAVLNACVSSDGIRWREIGTVATDGTFDSLNTWFYDTEAQLYRAYMRTWKHHYPNRDMGESGENETVVENPSMVRFISTSTSKDFRTWTKPVMLEFGDAPEYQLYTNNVQPYYRAPHILVGFPTRYYERQWLPCHEKLPDAEERKRMAGKSMRGGTVVTDALFMCSRDGLNFKRYDYPAFLSAGIERRDTWWYGDAYLAHGMIEVTSALEGAPNELSFYAFDRSVRAIRRYALRIDGFVSLRADRNGAVLLTKPLIFEGSVLKLNYACSGAGSLWVELLDEHMNPIPGYSFKDCDEMIGDTIDREVTWRSGDSNLSRLCGKIVHLRIRLRESELYSFVFE